MSTVKTKEFTNIQLKIENDIGYLYIDHPPANTLSSETVQGLSECIDYVIGAPEIKALIITGEGRFFVAGADIKEFTKAFHDKEKGKELSVRAQAVLNKIESMTKPVIAAINGACLGGGLELAMSCHMRIAADEAKLGQPELNLGLIPGFGGTQRLARITNKGKAMELILTGKMISGSEAEQIGLVNRSVPLTQLLDEATALARSIIDNRSQLAISRAIRAINEGFATSIDEGLNIEAELWSELFMTEDVVEGVQAFIEKRQPQFKNR